MKPLPGRFHPLTLTDSTGVARKSALFARILGLLAASAAAVYTARAQLVDRTLAPNLANEGIAKSFADEVGAGRGDWFTPDSSSYIITRDPFRAIRRGRQLFQRKFNVLQGAGPITQNGSGNIGHVLAIGAGLADSCATCDSRPRRSA